MTEAPPLDRQDWGRVAAERVDPVARWVIAVWDDSVARRPNREPPSCLRELRKEKPRRRARSRGRQPARFALSGEDVGDAQSFRRPVLLVRVRAARGHLPAGASSDHGLAGTLVTLFFVVARDVRGCLVGIAPPPQPISRS